MTTKNPFKYFNTLPKIILLAVIYYVRYLLSFCQVEDILHERGINFSQETIPFWMDQFTSKFSTETRKKRVSQRNGAAAKKFLFKAMRKNGLFKKITTDNLQSYGATFREIGV